jgi:predicted glycoside hydrolase/deacetylase ChbG (UPF0249 family)
MKVPPITRRQFLWAGASAGAGLLACKSERIANLLARMQPSAAERLGYAKDARLVIIHADDIGSAFSANAATMAAYELGAINSGSIMVPCPGFEEFATWARTHPRLDLGLHLTFISERPAVRWGPVLPPDQVPSLVEPDGYFPLHWSPSRPVRPSEIEAEIRAQIERARQFGIEPTHLDSHQHFLQLDGADVFEVLVRVAREHRLPFRVARAWFHRRPYLRRPSMQYTVPLDTRIEMHPGFATAEQWGAWYVGRIRELRPGVTEILVHPGYDNAELRRFTQDDPSWGAAWRQRDFDVVRSPEFQGALRDIGAVPVTWQELGKLLRA